MKPEIERLLAEADKSVNSGLHASPGWASLVSDLAAALRQASEDAERMNMLVDLAGHLGDGSFQDVTLCADDATREWYVMAGKRRFAGGSVRAAIDAARREGGRE